MVRHHRRGPGSRGYVAVSGDDQQHHAAIRGERKSRPRRQRPN